MNKNYRNIAIALCMGKSENTSTNKPLTVAEFYELLSAIEKYNGINDSPEQMSLFDNARHHNIDFTYLNEVDANFLSNELRLNGLLPEKVVSLLKRMNSLAFELERLESLSIKVCTVFDDDYPAKLKAGLRNLPNSMREPPVLYCCGDLSIATHNFAGFVGSRDVSEDDSVWTRLAVEKINLKAEREQLIFGVVSGGAEGIDRIAEDAAISLFMPVVEFSKNMRITLQDSRYSDAIMEGKMLLISEVNPMSNLSRIEATSHFMNRNKYIYATANYTIVVKSDIGSKSGTWSGASEAIKRKIGKVFVRDVNHIGNRDLIKMGATPLSMN